MKILCVLYDDPKDGMPKNYPLSELPELKKYPDGMTLHTLGTSLSAQARYAAGTREILECLFDDIPIRTQYLIVQNGELASVGAHSYSKGTATGGSEEAEKYKR